MEPSNKTSSKRLSLQTFIGTVLALIGIILMAFSALMLLASFSTGDFVLGLVIFGLIFGSGFLALKFGLRRFPKKQVLGNDIYAQIENIHQDHAQALASSNFTPEQIGTHKRSYHYKDVEIWVTWQYSGRYEKSCESAGIRCGDHLDLVCDNHDEDPDSVSVLWKGDIIGHMKSNRMRIMVRQWQENGLPVFCAVSHVGGETKILLEFAFYGFVKYK